MPLTLYNETEQSANPLVLDKVEFHNQDGDRFFTLSDSKKEIELRIKYVPNFESDRDPDRYECFLFENAYLTAENDVFEINENSITGRLGWIFPVSALDSNENDYAENNSFKHYRHIAYQKLLRQDYSLKSNNSKNEFLLSEIFQGISICILSKDEIAKINDFKITNYSLSFLKYDYLIFNKQLRSKRSFKKDSEVDALRKGNHRIRIRKAAYDITQNQYVNSLFIEHVYQTENVLTKYILLYQVLEQFIQEYGDSLLDEIIKEYQDKKITKNGLKEKIGKIQNDRSLMKKPFEKAAIKREVREAFLYKCSFLFNDLNLKPEQNFEDAIYDFRNLLTHNYRLLTGKTNELSEIIYLFELVILELLITFNEKKNESVAEPAIKQQNAVEQEDVQIFIDKNKTIKQKAIESWNGFLAKLAINN